MGNDGESGVPRLCSSQGISGSCKLAARLDATSGVVMRLIPGPPRKLTTVNTQSLDR